MRKFEGNLICKIREVTGKNQTDFGRMFGRTLPSVQAYERGTVIPPREVIEQLKKIAIQAGAPHLAEQFNSKDWNVRRIVETGQISISAPVVSPATAHSGATGDPHEALDAILHSGQDDAIEAVLANLHCFGTLVHIREGQQRVFKNAKKKSRDRA